MWVVGWGECPLSQYQQRPLLCWESNSWAVGKKDPTTSKMSHGHWASEAFFHVKHAPGRLSLFFSTRIFLSNIQFLKMHCLGWPLKHVYLLDDPNHILSHIPQDITECIPVIIWSQKLVDGGTSAIVAQSS